MTIKPVSKSTSVDRSVRVRSASVGNLTPVARSTQDNAFMRAYLVGFLPFVFSILNEGAPALILRWYLRAMCHAFQRAALGLVTRLVINVPPRHLKSITAVAFMAWMLGHNPRTKIMLATYGSKLAREHLQNLQKVMSHPRYRRLFPHSVLAANGLSSQLLKTTSGGGCRAVSVGGAVTGFGADIIIIDDSMKAEDIVSEARREELDRFYGGTLLTRLNNKRNGVIISIQQRLGEDDLPGRLIEAGAEHLCLPSYDDEERVFDIGFGRVYRRPVGEVLRPDDEPREVLDRFRREMGPASFATEYLQRPSAVGGNLIPIDRIPRFDLADYPRKRFNRIVISVDPATSEDIKADCSVLLICGHLDEQWYLLEVMRDRINYAKLRDRIRAQAQRWKADAILIEDAGAGQHLWSDFISKRQLRPVMIRPEVNKETRMVGQLGLIEDGVFLIPREAPFLEVFLREVRAFPRSKHDDQVDALSQFLFWAKTHTNWAKIEYDPKTGRKQYVIRPETVRRR